MTNGELLHAYSNLALLLRKYIKFVEVSEGSNFIDDYNRHKAAHGGDVVFTDEEWTLLDSIARPRPK